MVHVIPDGVCDTVNSSCVCCERNENEMTVAELIMPTSASCFYCTFGQSVEIVIH